MPENRKSPLIPVVVALAAGVALVVVLLTGNDEDTRPATTSSSPAGQPAGTDGGTDGGTDEAWEALARREADDPTALGEVDAPVVMIAYSEFQCPFCGKFARDTEPELIEDYVEDGTLRIEWRDFPYLGPESTTAALAGRAAAQQDRFWEFHDALYADQLPPNSGGLDTAYVVAIAEDLGLDVEQFLEDLEAPGTKRAVAEDFAQGQAIGVTGTPAFVINGVPVIGAQPVEVFREAIEQAAADAAS